MEQQTNACLIKNSDEGYKSQLHYFQYCWLYLNFPYNKAHFYNKIHELLFLISFAYFFNMIYVGHNALKSMKETDMR